MYIMECFAYSKEEELLDFLFGLETGDAANG
jgi:hypothetical protein